MNRRELDKEILNAIEVLKQHGKKVTAINIQNISKEKLRLYQIYTSKHKNLMEVRDKKSKIVEVKTETEAASEKTKNIGLTQKPSKQTDCEAPDVGSPTARNA